MAPIGDERHTLPPFVKTMEEALEASAARRAAVRASASAADSLIVFMAQWCAVWAIGASGVPLNLTPIREAYPYFSAAGQMIR